MIDANRRQVSSDSGRGVWQKLGLGNTRIAHGSFIVSLGSSGSFKQ
ncbi:MAG: hypothetical protein HZA31_02920 [Opitutae bacterium]|nr:hypothetical protein [Opitutae bacterium]